MYIDCPACDAALELPDGTSGAETECPVCGSEFVIPEERVMSGALVAERWTRHPSVFDADDVEPVPEAELAAIHCPICEAENSTESTDCRACGTNFRRTPGRSRHRTPRGIFVGDILWTTLTLFGRSFRVLVPAIILEATALAIAATLVLFPVLVVLGFLVANNPNANPVLAAFLLTCVLMPLFLIWQAMHVGHYRTMLKLARGEPVSFGELFSIRGLLGGQSNRQSSGGSLTVKMVGLGCLFWLLCLLGGMFLVVPGLVFALVAWPFGRIVVDRNPPGTMAITESIELVTPHWPGVLSVVSLLWAMQIGITVVPYLAGSVFATLLLFLVLQPFASLALTVTYLRLRDEPTALENDHAEAEWV